MTATPESSNIAGFAYVQQDRVLAVSFKSGSAYLYHQVPASEVKAFRDAPSKGRFFIECIRDKFRAEKVTEVELANLLGRPAVPKAPRDVRPIAAFGDLLLRYPFLRATF
jgi:hypothetical protein